MNTPKTETKRSTVRDCVRRFVSSQLDFEERDVDQKSFWYGASTGMLTALGIVVVLDPSSAYISVPLMILSYMFAKHGHSEIPKKS